LKVTVVVMKLLTTSH